MLKHLNNSIGAKNLYAWSKRQLHKSTQTVQIVPQHEVVYEPNYQCHTTEL